MKWKVQSMVPMSVQSLVNVSDLQMVIMSDKMKAKELETLSVRQLDLPLDSSWD